MTLCAPRGKISLSDRSPIRKDRYQGRFGWPTKINMEKRVCSVTAGYVTYLILLTIKVYYYFNENYWKFQITVRETVRPVCLLVDGNVPSCDHIHNNYYNDDNPKNPKNPTAVKGRRPTTVVDYESYFVDPSKPDETIEWVFPKECIFIIVQSISDTDW